MIRRITSEDADERMPPAKTGRKLTAAEIETIRAWIAGGAKYSKHWSYEPPQRPPLPNVSRPDWCRNAIDYFVLAQLDQAGLAPEPEADRYRLIRRLSLDLTGLPPTIEEVDAFVHDDRPDAYERLVDRLLASPAYGEHWARKWLDLARYADTTGYEKDSMRTDLAVSRLGDQRAQRRHAVRSIHDRATCRRPVARVPRKTKSSPPRFIAIPCRTMKAASITRSTASRRSSIASIRRCRCGWERLWAAASATRTSTIHCRSKNTTSCSRFSIKPQDANRYDQEPLLLTPTPRATKTEGRIGSPARGEQTRVCMRNALTLADAQREWETQP